MASRTKHLEHLAEIPLFSALSKRDLGRIAKASNEITVEPGKDIDIDFTFPVD